MRLRKTDLMDFQWEAIKQLLDFRIRRRQNMRKMINGILYREAKKCSFTMIPEEYGTYNEIVGTYYRMKKKGVWEKILLALDKLEIWF